MNPSPLATLDEAAAFFRVEPACVRKWIKEKRIPVIFINQRVIRLNLEKCLAALEERYEVKAKTAA